MKKTVLTVKFLVIIAGLLLTGSRVFAQQDPLYTQYMFDGLLINPAYAGSHDALSFTALTRMQWADFPGRPFTQTFTAHAPLKKRVSLGGSLVHDRLGSTTRNGVTGMYAYHIPMGLGKLSFGLQGSMMSFRSGDLNAFHANDPLNTPIESRILPDFGAGVYYYTDKFFAGISAPSLLSSDVKTKGDQPLVFNQYKRHYFSHVGYVFQVGENLKVKPNVLVKYVADAPMQIDLNTNVLISETLWLGVSYRSLDAFSVLAEFQLKNPNLRIGYAFDLASTAMFNHQYGSHEIAINYRIKPSKEVLLTPRYF
jgi:type IX secretion system PorP/SprF family membrane protein